MKKKYTKIAARCATCQRYIAIVNLYCR